MFEQETQNPISPTSQKPGGKSFFSQEIVLKAKKPVVFAALLAILLAGFIGGGYFGPKIYEGGRMLYQDLKGKWPQILHESFPFFFGPPQNPAGQSASQSADTGNQSAPPVPPYTALTSQEQAVIEVVKNASPAVVSIVISKEVSTYGLNIVPENPFGEDSPFRVEIPGLEPQGTKKQTVGGGTGFFVSQDGLILTNRHVVEDDKAEYTAITNDGRKYPVKVLAKDPFQDLALAKIEQKETSEKFPVLPLGDANSIQIGQTVVAIGYALGEFRNTVSVGVISGLGRTITAEGGGMAETLEDILQTDAAINRGNSGGPLLNLKGEVIGVNVAIAEPAQSIGFAIPVNKAKRDIEQVKATGKIVYPFLGVRYILITPDLQEEKKLAFDYGALLVKGEGEGEPAVIPGSVGVKAGLKEGDIILEADGQKVTSQNSLSKIVQAKKPGDKMRFKVWRDDKELVLEIVLGEKTSD